VSDEDLDDFADLDFEDTDEDDFSDLDFEDENPEVVYTGIDLSKPLCATCGNGEAIAGPTKRSRCQMCNKGWAWDALPEITTTGPKKSNLPAIIRSGHCGYPASKDPQLSHERCARRGAGSYANPAKAFYPCPCACHLTHEVAEGDEPVMNLDGTLGQVALYECPECGQLMAEAPAFGTDEDGDPIYVHVNPAKGYELLYYGPCQGK
jgi:hypothetical protein